MIKVKIFKKEDEDTVIFPKDDENHGKKVKRLLYHQRQLHHFLELYYNKEKYTDSERDYYKKFTDATYRKHLAMTAKLQAELNQSSSEATF